MTLQEIKSRFSIRSAVGYGRYNIFIRYRRRYYHCISTDTVARDRLSVEGRVTDSSRVCGLTLRQAYERFFNECMRKNNLI